MIRFIAVFLIFCNCMMRRAAAGDVFILRLAMAVTVMADFNMLITGNILYGVYLFCVVQMIYCMRYAGSRLCGALLALWAVLLIVLPPLLDPVTVSAAIYAVSFSCSLSAAFLSARKKYPYPNSLFVCWGMGLFACCDICVAVNYLFPGSTYGLIWVFYLPSQILLSVSSPKAQNSDDYISSA